MASLYFYIQRYLPLITVQSIAYKIILTLPQLNFETSHYQQISRFLRGKITILYSLAFVLS